MQFPFNLFSDLLAEFQKYLTNSIARPVYWTIGLVVVALSLLAGYLAGWNTLLESWNTTDPSLKLVLSGAVIVAFLLLAYLLGRLQSTVERWFQGEWPRRLQERSRERHRTIWQTQQDNAQMMGDLYGKLYSRLKEMTRAEPAPDISSPILRTTRPLPPYTFITEKDLAATETAEAPVGALHDKQAALGMMTLRPIDANTVLAEADVLRLPATLDQIEITSLCVSARIIPAGLVPGNHAVIYARTPQQQAAPCKPVLVLAAQHIEEEKNGAKTDLVQLTIAVAAADIDAFVVHTSYPLLQVVHPISQTTPASTPQTAGQQTAPPTVVASAPPATTTIAEQIGKLETGYQKGQQWLKRLRTGNNETDIPPYREALDQAFALIKEQASTTAQDDYEKDLRRINDYRYKWILLLQETYNELEYRIDKHKKTFFLYYPATIDRIAPTAIGNVFSAVDSYCDRLYGIDIALVLPNLQAVMADGTRDQLTKAHEQLELFEWLYLGSIAVGLIGTLMACYAQHYLLALVLWTLVLPIPRLVLYQAALKAALDYAAALRLAIDTERGKIIEQAGFSLPSPTSQEQEKALWKKIQQWWMYGISPGDYTLPMEGAKHDTNTEQT